jgi:hypothetical protein
MMKSLTAEELTELRRLAQPVISAQRTKRESDRLAELALRLAWPCEGDMSVWVPLSDATARRYAKATGLPIIGMLRRRRGQWRWQRFLTSDHRHGAVHATTMEVVFEPEPVEHWQSCPRRPIG